MVEGAIRAALEEGLGAVTAPGLARRAGVGAGAARGALAAFAAGPAGAGRGKVWLLGGWTKEGGAGAGGRAPSRHVLTLCRDADLESREGGLERVTVKQLYALSPGEGVGTDAGALWRADAEHLRDLHAEPADLKNCLRDNRHSTIAAPPGVTRAKGTSTPGGGGGAKPQGKPLQNLQRSADPSPTSPPVPAGQLPRKAAEKAAPKLEPRGGESGRAKPSAAGRAAAQPAAGGRAGSAEASGGNLASMFSRAPPKAEAAPEKKKRPARQIIEDESEDEDEDGGSEGARGGDAGPPEEEENYFEESPAKKARVEAPEAAAAPAVVGAPELNKRKEERTTINDKGEEVTEVVWVDKAGHPCSPPPKGPPPGAKPPRALPEKPAAAAPFPKRTPPRKTPPKRTPSSAEKKPGKQKGIVSFFGRK